jgi:hypothetical protein
LSNLQRSRSDIVAKTRKELAEVTYKLRSIESRLAQSVGMLARFNLLNEKYTSDLERLVGLDEGINAFQLLEDVPCPVCDTPISSQVAPELVLPQASSYQRRAFEAEAKKILALRDGLLATISAQTDINAKLEAEQVLLRGELERLAKAERAQIEAGIDEFTVSIATLAEKRSDLFSHIKSLEEIERLRREAARLANISRSKTAPISRALIADGDSIAGKVLALLKEWGFESIHKVAFDPAKFDVQIDGRTRTSYGQGTRALFLAAYYIAILEHCVQNNRPHPGIVMIDSPLKNFSDARENDDPEVSKDTVKNRFYSWLSSWEVRGQLIIMENEPPLSTMNLNVLTFTGKTGEGRYGLFPELSQAV